LQKNSTFACDLSAFDGRHHPRILYAGDSMKSRASHFRSISPEQKESAELIAILMKVAKSVDQLRMSPGVSLEQFILAALDAQADLLRVAHRLYPEAGDMERSVLAFASRLDIDLSLKIPIYSNAIH
jgi:hypothetical protein